MGIRWNPKKFTPKYIGFYFASRNPKQFQKLCYNLIILKNEVLL